MLDVLIDQAREAVWTTVLVAAPLLLAGLAVGLLVGGLQAATQIQDSSLSLIPPHPGDLGHVGRVSAVAP